MKYVPCIFYLLQGGLKMKQKVFTKSGLFPFAVEAHPVYLHFDRQVGRVDLSHPRAAKLHVEQQVEVLVGKRELPLLVGLYAGVGKRALVVDEEHKAVAVHFNAVHVIVVGVYPSGAALRGIVIYPECVGVGRMHRLVCYGVVVEPFHYVDFAAVGPRLVFRQQPSSSCKIRRIAYHHIDILTCPYIFIKTLIFGDPVQGFPTIMIVMLFLGGVQLLSIGVLGEYIGRIFNESKHRPAYIAREYDGELIK